jgi:hypothetical protein
MIEYFDMDAERVRIRAIVDSARKVMQVDEKGCQFVYYEFYVNGKRYEGELTKIMNVHHIYALGDMVEAREKTINRLTEAICRRIHPGWEDLLYSQLQPRNITHL